MAHNGEEFIIILSDSDSDDSGDEGEFGNVQDPEIHIQINLNQDNQMNPGPQMAPDHENTGFFKELQAIQLPVPLTPEPSFFIGSSSSSSSSFDSSGGTITITDSAPMELDNSNKLASMIPAAVPPPNRPPLTFWHSSKAVMLISGLDAHITLCVSKNLHDLRTTMKDTLENFGVGVVLMHATLDDVKTLYFFHAQVTSRAFVIPSDQWKTPHDIFVEAMVEFMRKFPEDLPL